MYANLYPSADVCLKHLFFCAKCIGVSSSWLFEVSTVVFFTSCLTWKKWGVVVVWVCRKIPLVTCFVCLDSCITEQKENTGRFVLFSVITNIYNKKAKGPTLMELFTATGKLIFFLTTRDVRCVHHGWHGTLFKFLPHTRQHVDACVARTWISYRCVPCHPCWTHRTTLVVKKKKISFPVAVNSSIKVGPLAFLL